MYNYSVANMLFYLLILYAEAGAMQEMTLWPSETMIENERPAKKLKHLHSYQESDAMPSVITAGDETITGKRTICIVCVCYGN